MPGYADTMLNGMQHLSGIVHQRRLEENMQAMEAIRQANLARQYQVLAQQSRARQIQQQMQMLGQQRQAQALADLNNQRNTANNIALKNLEARLTQMTQPKAPLGYRFKPDNSLEKIPGGPADIKQAGVFNQDTSALQSGLANLDRVGGTAKALLSHPGLAGITGIRGAFPNIPGSNASNAQALLDTLKSQVGFGVLQEMRNSSKTGGALGQISDKEEKLLQDNIAALGKSQDEESYKKNLSKIVDYVEGSKNRLAQAYNMKYGDMTATQPQTPQPQTPQQQAPDQAIKYLMSNPTIPMREAFKRKYGYLPPLDNGAPAPAPVQAPVQAPGITQYATPPDNGQQ